MMEDKRLLVIAHSYNNYVRWQTNALADYFAEVHVLVRYNGFSNIVGYVDWPRLNKYKKYTREYKIEREDTPGNVNIVPTPLYYLPLDIHRKYLDRQHYRAVKKIVQQIGIDFDLVHAHITWTAGHVGVKLGETFDVPVVLTVHENRSWLQREADSPRINSVWNGADAIIRVNEQDINVLRQHNPEVHYVPNGFDSKTFSLIEQDHARRELGIDEDIDVVFSLGNLVERKGFDHLVMAMAQVAQDRDRVVCYIGGSGSARATLEKLIEQEGLTETVSLLGYVPQAEVNYWMNVADVFVLPSHSESFGIAQLEALACGTPVVATRNGGSEQIIRFEDHGRLVDSPEHHDELAKTIVDALGTEWTRSSIREYAARFTWETICEEILEIYTRAIDVAKG